MKKGTLEELFDDEDFSYYDDWLADIDNIRTIVFDLAKSMNFVEVFLYGEYTHVISHGRKDKVVRIATKSDEHLNNHYDTCGAWDILEEGLSDYQVVFTDYDYLMAGKADTGAKPDDLTMFHFGNWIIYSSELEDKEDLRYIPCVRGLTEEEMRAICGFR